MKEIAIMILTEMLKFAKQHFSKDRILKIEIDIEHRSTDKCHIGI